MTAEELESFTEALFWEIVGFPHKVYIGYADRFLKEIGFDGYAIPILSDPEFVECLRKNSIACWVGGDGLVRFVRQRKTQLYSPYFLSRNRCAYCAMLEPGEMIHDPENAERRVHAQCAAPLAKLRLRIKTRRANGCPEI